jgi:hypothetical protein
MKIKAPSKYDLNQGVIAYASFQTQHESNTENGHDFWEEEEYVTIRKVELLP